MRTSSIGQPYELGPNTVCKNREIYMLFFVFTVGPNQYSPA